MKHLDLIALVVLIISLNACVKSNNINNKIYYKGKLISKKDSLPKVNTTFILWEQISGGYAPKYSSTLVNTNDKGYLIVYLNKSSYFYLSPEYDEGNYINFGSKTDKITTDTIFLMDTYYSP